MDHPDGSMVMPGDFIPLYEKDGLIVKLDEYIFRYVCEFQRELMEKGQELIPISVKSVAYKHPSFRYC